MITFTFCPPSEVSAGCRCSDEKRSCQEADAIATSIDIIQRGYVIVKIENSAGKARTLTQVHQEKIATRILSGKSLT